MLPSIMRIENCSLIACQEQDEAFGRLQVTYDPLSPSLMTAAKSSFDAGFLGRQMPDLSRLYDLNLLNQVLAEKGKRAVQ